MLTQCTDCTPPHHYDDAATQGETCRETLTRPIDAHVRDTKAARFRAPRRV